MKRIIAIVLLCWSAGVMAEEKVWYCTEVASAGLYFEYGKYETTPFIKKRITIKQDDLRFTFSDGYYKLLHGFNDYVMCDRPALVRQYLIRCSLENVVNAVVFSINTVTGLASFHYGGGWVLNWERPDASSKVDHMNVTALECETF